MSKSFPPSPALDTHSTASPAPLLQGSRALEQPTNPQYGFATKSYSPFLNGLTPNATEGLTAERQRAGTTQKNFHAKINADSVFHNRDEKFRLFSEQLTLPIAAIINLYAQYIFILELSPLRKEQQSEQFLVPTQNTSACKHASS